MKLQITGMEEKGSWNAKFTVYLITGTDSLGAIEVAGVGLPSATSAAPNRYESAVVFWEAVKDSALASQPRRYFTLSDGEHRGIVIPPNLAGKRPEKTF